MRGQVGDGERFVQVTQGVFAYGGQGVGVPVRVRGGVFDELGLAAGAEGGGDHRAGDGGGRLRAVGAADQVEAEVDAGCRAGGGPDVVVLDEEGVGDDGDLGVVGAQEVDEVPVGDRPAAVEEAGLGEGEGSAAEGGEGGAAGVGSAEGVQDGGGREGEVVVQAGDQDEVGPGEPGEGAVGQEGEAAAHRDGRVVDGHPAQVEGGDAAVGAVGAPDLGDDGDVEGADAGEGDEGDPVRRLHRWQ